MLKLGHRAGLALTAWALLSGSVAAQDQSQNPQPAPAQAPKPKPKPRKKPLPKKPPQKVGAAAVQDTIQTMTPQSTSPPAPPSSVLAQPVTPLTPEPPPQPSLAQPSPPAPSVVHPTAVQPSASRSSTLPQTLVQPRSMEESASSASPTVAARAASLSTARPLGNSDARSSTPEASPSTGAPPPLALPTGNLAQTTAMQASLAQSSSLPPTLAPSASSPAPPAAAPRGKPDTSSQAAALSGRRLTFTQEKYDSPAHDAPYAVAVTLRARSAMHPASVVFQCSERVDRAGVPVPEGASFKQLRESYLNPEKTAYWLVFDEPSIEPGDTFTIILMSARPIRVINVTEGPSVKEAR